MFLLFAMHLLFLGIAMWYARKWRITFASFGCLGLSLIMLWGYLIFTITLPEYFSYSGTTSVFLAFSFIPILYIHYRIDTVRNRIEYISYFKIMDEEAPKDSKLSEILRSVQTNQKKSRCLWFKVNWIDNSHFMYIIYLIILVVYGIFIRAEADKEHSALGFINMAVIIIYDLILIVWGYFSVEGYILSPLKVTLVILATRIVLCFNPDYWILTHSLVFLGLLILFMTMWILKNIHVDNKKNKRARNKKELLEVIRKCDKLKSDLSKETEGLVPEELTPPKYNRYARMVIEIIPMLILFVTFFVYGIIIWSSDIDRARAKDLKVDNENLNQGIVIGFSIALFFSYIPMAIWFRVFQIYQFTVSCKMLFSAIASYAIIVCIFIVYGATVLSDIDSESSVAIIT